MGLRTEEHQVLRLYFICLLYLICSTGSFGYQRYPLTFEHPGTLSVNCQITGKKKKVQMELNDLQII